MAIVTLESIKSQLDRISDQAAASDRRNDEAHNRMMTDQEAMTIEQRATTQRLSTIDIASAVELANTRTHRAECDKRHRFINRILWTVATGAAAGVGWLFTRIIGG
jgi:hypothetical protein